MKVNLRMIRVNGEGKGGCQSDPRVWYELIIEDIKKGKESHTGRGEDEIRYPVALLFSLDSPPQADFVSSGMTKTVRRVCYKKKMGYFNYGARFGRSSG